MSWDGGITGENEERRGRGGKPANRRDPKPFIIHNPHWNSLTGLRSNHATYLPHRLSLSLSLPRSSPLPRRQPVMTQGTEGATHRESKGGTGTEWVRTVFHPSSTRPGFTAYGMSDKGQAHRLLACLFVFQFAPTYICPIALPRVVLLSPGASQTQPHAPHCPSPQGQETTARRCHSLGPPTGRGVLIRACGIAWGAWELGAWVAWTASSESDRPWERGRADVRLSIHPPGARRDWSTRLNRSARIRDGLVNVVMERARY